MWNRTYQILGSSVVLNAKGDRESDWSVGDFNKDTGRFEVSFKSALPHMVSQLGQNVNDSNPAASYTLKTPSFGIR